MVSALASAPFSFHQITKLRSGQAFQIQSQGRPIGQGRILALSTGTLQIQFSVQKLLVPVEGEVSLKVQRGQKNGQLIGLVYSGTVRGQKEASRETVLAPHYLLARQILSFSYHSGQRFFQLSRNKAGLTTLVTDWGAVQLIPEG